MNIGELDDPKKSLMRKDVSKTGQLGKWRLRTTNQL